MFNNKLKKIIQQEYFHQPNRKLYKDKYNYILQEKSLTDFGLKINNIDQGKRELPKVWSRDKVSTTAQDNNTEKGNKIFHECNFNYDKLRMQKAKLLLLKENAIRKIKNNIYLVRSQTGCGWYKVQWNGLEWVCNCPDFTKHGHITPCKHVIALQLRIEIGYVPIEGEITEIKSLTCKQNWSKYNLAQTSEIELFDQFLYQLVSYIEEPEPSYGPGRPPHSLKDLIFCCIMKVYSQLSSRRSQCLFHQALQRQQLSERIHYNAISRMLLKKEFTPVLYELVRLSAKPLASVEHDFAVDSSGFRCSSFGYYCEEKHKTKHWRNWLKVHIITGVSTNIVASVSITDEHSGDSPQFEKLVKDTAEYFQIHEISADMAYSARKNLDLVGKLGGTAYIPFRKGATGTSRGSRLWNKTFHYFQLHREEFMEHYHKRSNVESTFSAIKKKFGETLKSKNRTAQVNEMLCKIISYNITVLIHEMIALDIDLDMLLFNGMQNPNIQQNQFFMTSMDKLIKY